MKTQYFAEFATVGKSFVQILNIAALQTASNFAPRTLMLLKY